MENKPKSWKFTFLNKIITGNSIDVLKEIPDKSINLVITSPPYFQQRNYTSIDSEIGNEDDIKEYIINIMKVFHECVRILRNDGSIVFNLGDKYFQSGLMLVPYRFAIEAIENEPVKIINHITWIKKNPTPRQDKRKLVSSFEPFFIFVKSIKNYYFNKDEFLKSKDKKRKKNISSAFGQKYFSLVDESDLTEDEKEHARIELQKVIEEVKKGETFDFRMKIRGIHAPAYGGMGGGRNNQIQKNGFTIIRMSGESMKKDLIESAVESKNGWSHPAVYPESVILELIKLLSKEENIVLDPFVGSGTTCIAAAKLGRRYIGIDINQSYCDISRRRIGEIIKERNITDFI